MEPTVALKPLFNEIAAAIHEKDGLADSIPAYNFPERIRAIPAGGASLESIYISSPPDKTSYLVGETFDPTGLVVIAVFDNDKTLIIDNSELTFTPSGELEEDTTEVTISYQFGDITKTATQEVTVAYFPATLNECSWEFISELSQNGTFADHFSVGDTKTIVLNGQIGNGFTADNLEIDLVVVGINHNAELEGNNLVHFMLGYKDGNLLALTNSVVQSNKENISGYFTMNLTNDNTGGWLASHMRAVIMGGDGTPTNPVENTLMSALPADLRAVMRSAKKWTNNVGGGTNTLANITETTEFLCPIDEYELDGTTVYAYSDVVYRQQRYSYFADKGNIVPIFGNDGAGTLFYFRGPSPYSGRSYWDGGRRDGTPDYVSQYYSKALHALLFV